MAPTDPKEGGDLFDMAKDGTTMPNDAGKHNLIPSVPRPDQKTDPTDDPNTLGRPDIASAADNATDIPRSTRDIGQTGEVITGIGDTMPATSETKRNHFTGDPLSKGHQRYDKHTVQKESDLERFAGEGAGMEDVPGQEGEGREARERNEAAN